MPTATKTEIKDSIMDSMPHERNDTAASMQSATKVYFINTSLVIHEYSVGLDIAIIQLSIESCP